MSPTAKDYSTTRTSSIAFIVGLLALILSGGLLILQVLRGSPTGQYTSTVNSEVHGYTDIIQLPDEPEKYYRLYREEHHIRIVEGIISGEADIRETEIALQATHKDIPGSTQRIDARFCPPCDIDSDGRHEIIVQIADSASYYMYALNQDSNPNLIFQQEGLSSIGTQNWQNVRVLGCGQFSVGSRMVLQKDGDGPGTPRELLFVDPVAGKIEDVKITGETLGCSGFLPVDQPLKNAFYISAYEQIPTRFSDPNPNSLARLLQYHPVSGHWQKNVRYAARVPVGNLYAQPYKLQRDDLWIISAGIHCYIINAEGVIQSNNITSARGTFLVEGAFDSDQDGSFDTVYLSNFHEIMQVKIVDECNLTTTNVWASVDRLKLAGDKRLHFTDSAHPEEMLLALLTNRKTLVLLDHNLNQVSDINLADIIETNPSVSHSVKHSYDIFLSPRGDKAGNILLNWQGQGIIIHYQALRQVMPGWNITVILIFTLSLLSVIILVAKAQSALKVKQNQVTEGLVLFRRTMKIFRKKPTDVVLYVDHYFSPQWHSIQQRVQHETQRVLSSREESNLHDSIREEVGLPMSGTERLVNLLVLRRVTLNYLRSGFRGIHLIDKLNFQIDPKYKSLIKEARTVLKTVIQRMETENLTRLSEEELDSLIRNMEAEHLINDTPAPRRIFSDLIQNEQGVISGSLRYSQAGREIKLQIDNEQVTIAYHGKLSPSFANFMSVIGLLPDADLTEQTLFVEEEENSSIA